MWKVASALVICLPLLVCCSAASCQSRERRHAAVFVIPVLRSEVCPCILVGKLARVRSRDDRLLYHTRRHHGPEDSPPPLGKTCRLPRCGEQLQSRVDTRPHPWRNLHL